MSWPVVADRKLDRPVCDVTGVIELRFCILSTFVTAMLQERADSNHNGIKLELEGTP